MYTVGVPLTPEVLCTEGHKREQAILNYISDMGWWDAAKPTGFRHFDVQPNFYG